jgi:hypothetical protein
VHQCLIQIQDEGLAGLPGLRGQLCSQPLLPDVVELPYYLLFTGEQFALIVIASHYSKKAEAVETAEKTPYPRCLVWRRFELDNITDDFDLVGFLLEAFEFDVVLFGDFGNMAVLVDGHTSAGPTSGASASRSTPPAPLSTRRTYRIPSFTEMENCLSNQTL